MTRTISFIAVVGAALLVAPPGWGKGQPLATDPATEAQILRGEEPSSGSEVDWEQVGVVVGIGILLAAGLFVAMRFTRVGPLGH
jgi:hypothetical protein